MCQQGFFPLGANARYRIKRVGKFGFCAFVAMRANGIAMRLIAQPLQKMHGRTIRRQGKAGTAADMKLLSASMPIRAF